MNWDSKLFARDLTTLIKLIGDYDVPVEIEKLSDLVGKLGNSKSAQVNISDIVINISKAISNTQPAGISRMAIYFSHICKYDEEVDRSKRDPIKEYYFFYQINGYSVPDKEYTYCWRLDQDIKGGNTPRYTHPYYHFQAGGDELQNRDSGELLLLSAPRLPHPPMDLFLGLHFLLNNYLSIKDYPSVKSLFAAYDYQEIIKRAQERVWVVYFNSFHHSNTHEDYTFKNVFPLFLH